MAITNEAENAIAKWQEREEQKAAEKAAAMRLVASDPELIAVLVNEFLLLNGTCASTTATASRTVKGLGKGELKFAVAEAVSKTVGRFTVFDVVTTMKRDGFEFTVQTPNVAVNSVLRKLISSGTIRIVQAGTGRIAHVYEPSEQQIGRRDLKVA